MSVLNVAQERAPQSETTSDSAPDTNGQQSSDAADEPKRIDIADSLSKNLEEFVSGLSFGTLDIKIDWGRLSPIFSTVGDIFGVVAVLWRWL